MRFFPISLLLLVWACSSYPERNQFQLLETPGPSIINPYFSDPAKDYVYKADINLYKRSFSGILVVKKLEDQHHRLVFTTEMGNTIFDFSFTGNDFIVNHILDEVNKKVIINLLKKDFKTLIWESPSPLRTFIVGDEHIFEAEIDKLRNYYHSQNGRLDKIVRTNNGKEKVTFIFSAVDAEVVKNIHILHHNIKLSIQLKAI